MPDPVPPTGGEPRPSPAPTGSGGGHAAARQGQTDSLEQLANEPGVKSRG